MDNCGVYAIENKISGRLYIGSAINFVQRWSIHRRELKSGIHNNHHLQYAWRHYTIDDFNFVILERTSKEKLIEREQVYLNYVMKMKPTPYNICPMAASQLGTKRSKEVRAKMSAAKVGNQYCLGRGMSDEGRAKLSKRNIGNQYHRGKRHSSETRAKLSAANIGNQNARKSIQCD